MQNEPVATIHDRMPAILAPSDYARWLGDEPDPRDLMRPCPAELMLADFNQGQQAGDDDPPIVEPIELTRRSRPAGARECAGEPAQEP
jgi:putative SOS response-associated peptidase YedK